MVLDTLQTRASSRSLPRFLLGAVPVLLIGACGGGAGSSGGQSGIIGEELPKPGGGTFFVDQNSSGGSTRLRLADVTYGRLVDVHDVDASGTPSTNPVFRDFVISEDVQSDGANYLLETNAITQKTRLVILRTKGAQSSSGTFDSLLVTAMSGLPVVTPRDDAGSGPFSVVPRNACIMLRFDDCLDDDAQSIAALSETVRVFAGYPPTTPFSARRFFDPNHGAVVGGKFHSTRILIDLTVSEAEAMTNPLPVNSVGLPASVPTSGSANVSIRIPTLVDFASGQFVVLTTLGGLPLTTSGNGPVDPSSPTFDVVRGMQSGNSLQQYNGFLRDQERPEIVGSWEAMFTTPPGLPALDFVLSLQFTTVCQSQLDVEDVLLIGTNFLEVTAPTGPPVGGIYFVQAHLVSETPLDPANLQGVGTVLSTYDPLLLLDNGCWVDFTPKPLQAPLTGIATATQVLARFTEPMDPATLSAFDTFVIGRGAAGSTLPTSPNTVVGEILSSPDLKTFTFVPTLPLNHTQGTSDTYHVRLFLPKDLAGNVLVRQLPAADFSVDPLESTVSNGGLVLRFSALDEVDLNTFNDLRGQIFYDLAAGKILPRFPSFQSFPVDRSVAPIQSLMLPLAPGVREPLVPLGCKLQTVWRYADFGWPILDETKYNLDVCGLDWAPRGGQVISEFYSNFEIRLSHSARLPDEQTGGGGLPSWPNSGLLGSPNFFADNILDDPLSPQKTVHPRSLGYMVRPVDLFLAAPGNVMLPFPLNRGGGPKSLYTWRDTAILSRAAPDGSGIPLDNDSFNPPPTNFAPAGQVPSHGLPLLMEFRCFPSSGTTGLNSFDVSVAVPVTFPATTINPSTGGPVPPAAAPPRPNFRVYSSGGVDLTGGTVVKNPDIEVSPSGGFNPFVVPPGQKSIWDGDNVSYLGQLDVVIRVSRAHTVWLNAQPGTTQYATPVLEPDPGLLPRGTEVVIEYRGATGFSGQAAATIPFDGTKLDAYGDIATTTATVNFFNSNTWKSAPSQLDGAQYIQARITFLNDIDTGLSPELSGLGLAFTKN